MSPVTTAGMDDDGEDEEGRPKNPYLSTDFMAGVMRNISGLPPSNAAQMLRASGIVADMRQIAALRSVMPDIMTALNIDVTPRLGSIARSLSLLGSEEVQALIRATSPRVDFSSLVSVDMSAALRESLALSSMRAVQAVLEAQRRIEHSETRDEGEIDTEELPDDDTLTHAVEEITVAVENADVQVDDGVKAALVNLWQLVAASKLDLSVSDKQAADDLRIALVFGVVAILSALLIAHPVVFGYLTGAGSIVSAGAATNKYLGRKLPSASAAEDDEQSED